MEDIYSIASISLVGIIAGVINTLAGGGLYYTSSTDFYRVAPQVANGTNRIAIVLQSLWDMQAIEVKGVSTFPSICI